MSRTRTDHEKHERPQQHEPMDALRVHEVRRAALLETDLRRLMIPVDNVAFVAPFHSLEHALLILIKSGYSAIPVLDNETVCRGTISKTLILDSILGLEDIEFGRLREGIVGQVMNKDVPMVKHSDTFLHALEVSVQHPFLCVENDEGVFVGLLPRQSILARLSRYLKD